MKTRNSRLPVIDAPLFGAALFGAMALAGILVAAPETSAQTPPVSDKKVWMSVGGERDEALKLKADTAKGREIYEVCSACHMPEGWGLVDGTFPQLAGQHRTVLIKQLEDIREGNRDNPTMYPFALASEIGGAQAVADVTEYIAHLPMNPENGVGSGKDLDHGKQLYADNCVRCHGDSGEGNLEKYFPRIQGQHYEYLVRQYRWIKEGKRRNANPEMIQQIQKFTERDTLAVLDYVSRLKPPAGMLAKPGWKNPDFQ